MKKHSVLMVMIVVVGSIAIISGLSFVKFFPSDVFGGCPGTPVEEYVKGLVRCPNTANLWQYARGSVIEKEASTSLSKELDSVSRGRLVEALEDFDVIVNYARLQDEYHLPNYRRWYLEDEYSIRYEMWNYSFEKDEYYDGSDRMVRISNEAVRLSAERIVADGFSIYQEQASFLSWKADLNEVWVEKTLRTRGGFCADDTVVVLREAESFLDAKLDYPGKEYADSFEKLENWQKLDGRWVYRIYERPTCFID